MSRRRFMELTSAAAVAAPVVGALGQTATTPPPPPAAARKIRKAVKLGMVQVDGSVRDKFQLLADLGFDGVEITSPNDLDADEIVAARDATGIVVHGVVCGEHWRSPLSDPDAAVRARCRTAMETAIDDAVAYGATTVLLVPGVVRKEVPYADAWERSRAEVGRLVPIAEDRDVTIAFENVWNDFLLSPLEARDYVDSFESDNVGWYFDVGNVVRSAWPEHWIAALGPRIVKVDVKEYSRKKRDGEGLWRGFDVELLEGDCDWPAVMRALDDIGYEGWFTAEIGGGGPERLAKIEKRMSRIIQS